MLLSKDLLSKHWLYFPCHGNISLFPFRRKGKTFEYRFPNAAREDPDRFLGLHAELYLSCFMCWKIYNPAAFYCLNPFFGCHCSKLSMPSLKLLSLCGWKKRTAYENDRSWIRFFTSNLSMNHPWLPWRKYIHSSPTLSKI